MDYIILFIASLFIAIVSYYYKLNNRVVLFVFLIGLLFFLYEGGYKIVVDYVNYINLYKTVLIDWRLAFLYNFEIGYLLLNVIVSKISTNHNAIFLISYALFLLLFKQSVIKHSPYPIISFFFIICVYYIDTPLRQTIATAIFLVSLNSLYLKEKKYFIFAFVAFLFHYLAILMVPLYFIARKRYSIQFYVGLILFSLFCYFFVDFVYLFSIINNLLGKNYFDIDKSSITAGILGLLLQLIIFCISIYYLKIANNKFYTMLFNINTLGVVIYLMFHSVEVLATRGSEILTVTQCILLPYCLYISKLKFNKIILLTFILLIWSYMYWRNVSNTYKYKDDIIELNSQ